MHRLGVNVHHIACTRSVVGSVRVGLNWARGPAEAMTGHTDDPWTTPQAIDEPTVWSNWKRRPVGMPIHYALNTMA
jgi:hypothetical protein